MNKIILANYMPGCGKDCFADYLVARHNYIKFSFASPIYDIAREFFDMKEKDRQLLIDIGQKMREINPNVWLDYAMKRADKLIKTGHKIIISDCRFENEYDLAVKNKFTPIRIVCDKDVAIKRILQRDGNCNVDLLESESEIGTRHLKAIEIKNNGTVEEFYNKIELLLKGNVK